MCGFPFAFRTLANDFCFQTLFEQSQSQSQQFTRPVSQSFIQPFTHALIRPFTHLFSRSSVPTPAALQRLQLKTTQSNCQSRLASRYSCLLAAAIMRPASCHIAHAAPCCMPQPVSTTIQSNFCAFSVLRIFAFSASKLVANMLRVLHATTQARPYILTFPSSSLLP